ncbi:MAG: DUF1273 domain-containing protein [Oscillatoriaceae cyanobacterium Prado104]|nr:DUF1273 domain-containing protein [Oscillatoriaceae cyanobacterium Prado104]
MFDFSNEYETAFVTGHRYVNRSVIPATGKLIDMAVAQGVTKFMVGMALGTDQIAAQILIDRKLWWRAVVPCKGQEKVWPQHFQDKYRKLLEKADDIVVLQEQYTKGCLNRRNTWMAARSQLCLAAYNGSESGGTAHAVGEARKRGMLIYCYNPKSQKFSVEEAHPKLTFAIDGTVPDRQTSNLFQFGIDNSF